MIYPNPVDDMVSISSSESGRVVIMTSEGKVVATVNGTSINIEHLKKGIYYGVVKKGNRIKAVKGFYKK